VNAYFGEPWGAPITDGQRREPTPLGVPCVWCRVPIAAGDQGILMGVVGLGGGASKPRATSMPYHRECLMRSTVGSPEHLDGKCTCRGGERPAEQTPQEMRAEALEVWRRVTSGELG
jgi:hypothetical protein